MEHSKNYNFNLPSRDADDIVDINLISDNFRVIDTVLNDAQNKGGITEETDPTVSAWAKQPNKPTYTAEEVGALPSDTKIPTKTSELTNDSKFITRLVSDLANYYTKSQTLSADEINGMISAVPKFSISVVSNLPTSNISETTIYLVGGGSGSDLYTEYIYTNGKWEILGSQRVDLTGYATERWVNTQLTSYLKSSELDTAISTALAQAKSSGEFDGEDGENGVSATHSWNGTTLTITSASGTSSANLKGDKGDKGDTGASGTSVTVKSVSESTADGGSNVVTFSDGKTLTVKNGSKGSTGANGKDGYTPVRGTDYWTDADKAEIKSYVDDAILGGAW